MKVHLIAIAGGSGSGKTWLARRVLAAGGAAAGYISLDDFYRDQSHLPAAARAATNYDRPGAIEWPLFHRCLAQIARGEPAVLPVYDFATHTRTPVARIWQPCPLVVLDGLWLLRRAALRRLYAWKIFVDCRESLRLQRRLRRDQRERGRTAESIRHQFARQVAPMHNRYVAGQAGCADLVLTTPLAASGLQAILHKIRQLPSTQGF